MTLKWFGGCILAGFECVYETHKRPPIRAEIVHESAARVVGNKNNNTKAGMKTIKQQISVQHQKKAFFQAT